jgi:predicted nucleic acid-binding Zn ribbon protein
MSQPELLKNALERHVRRSGIGAKLAQGRMLSQWSEIVGAQVAARATAESLVDGVLTVVAPDSSWRHELSFQKREMIERLNAAAGQKVVRDIFFVAVSRKRA